MTKINAFEEWEDDYIRENWETKSDEEIAQHIDRLADGVQRRRKKLGLTRQVGRPASQGHIGAIFANPSSYNLARLSKEDRLTFYRTQFEKSPRYIWLTQTLSDTELEYYKNKFIDTSDSLDTLEAQEEDILHNMIMKEIDIVRLRKLIRQQMNEYEQAPIDAKPPLNQQLYQDMERAEKQYVGYHEKLRLTREQRLKTDEEQRVTVSSLVRSFLDAKVRQEVGDMAGTMAYSTKKCKEDMKKRQFLLGEV
jgi:hypothetical protein